METRELEYENGEKALEDLNIGAVKNVNSSEDPEDFLSLYVTSAEKATVSLNAENETLVQAALSRLIKDKTALVFLRGYDMMVTMKIRRRVDGIHSGMPTAPAVFPRASASSWARGRKVYYENSPPDRRHIFRDMIAE